jgi:hypothetical protein
MSAPLHEKLLGTDGPHRGGASRIIFENHQWRTNDGRGDNCLAAALGKVVREFLSFLGRFEG